MTEEEHAVVHVDRPPRKKSPWGAEYHADEALGYHVQGERAEGTHKSNLPPPYGNDPDSEPGTVALEVKAGAGIFFTEALRHGGRTNRSDRVRKTIHVGYGPYWMQSQNMATMDEPPFITESTRVRWSEAQRLLFRSWPG